MIETPIQRKHTHYPKDFLPNPNPKTTHPKRFTFHHDYQIQVDSIKKYQQIIEEHPNHHQYNTPLSHSLQADSINPQIHLLANNQLQQENPLLQHLSKKHNLDEQLLKKPRFTMLDKAEVAEESTQLQNSGSPGCIRKQLEGRQIPLPMSDTCRIDLLISQNQVTKLSSSIIKYKSSGQFMLNKWKPTERERASSIRAPYDNNKMQGYNNSSRTQSGTHLPKVDLPRVAGRGQSSDGQMIQSAKQQYQRFRKRQQSHGSSFSKVNSLLASMHKKQSNQPIQPNVPQFQPSAILKLKQSINKLARNKVGRHKHQTNVQQQQSQDNTQHSTVSRKHNSRTPATKGQSIHDGAWISKPELQVSYRSSLSYLKDLYAQASQLDSYRLVVKIPKIFTEKLIFQQQEKQQLYQAARSVFMELKIECQNLVIKRYTNCTMVVARNICLIWHFDGKRYLGGWQSDYLDQGFKHGLGLQWHPRNYVYYGEYVKNKKHGLGVYKDRHENSYVGYWNSGRKCGVQQMQQRLEEQSQWGEGEEGRWGQEEQGMGHGQQGGWEWV